MVIMRGLWLIVFVFSLIWKESVSLYVEEECHVPGLCEGQVLDNFIASEEQCYSTCQKEESCNFISYWEDQRVCVLMEDCGSVTDCTRCYSSVKNCTHSSSEPMSEEQEWNRPIFVDDQNNTSVDDQNNTSVDLGLQKNAVPEGSPKTLLGCYYSYFTCTGLNPPSWPENKDICLEKFRTCQPYKDYVYQMLISIHSPTTTPTTAPSTAPTTAPTTAVTDCTWTYTDESTGRQSCFKLFRDAVNWNDASEKCKQNGGLLASPSTEAKNEFLKSKMRTAGVNDQVWFGASADVASTSKEGWTFVTGEEISSFQDWRKGEPNGDGKCASYLGTPGQWNDVSCTREYNYICEY